MMNFNEEGVVEPTDLHRLIENTNGGADLHEFEKALHILGVEPDTSVTNAHPDPEGAAVVCAVNEVSRDTQFKRELSQGILGVSPRNTIW